MAWSILAMVWLFSTPAMVSLLVRSWEPPRKILETLNGPYDFAVVLGGLSYPELTMGPHVEFNARSERLLSALMLYKKGIVKGILIASGSADLANQNWKEADPLGQFALDNGVRPQDLILERNSRNTYENALFSKPLLEKAGAKKIILVTSAFHMPRSAGIFAKMGYQFESWPVDTMALPPTFPSSMIPDPGALDTLQILLKEWVGVCFYKLAGYL